MFGKILKMMQGTSNVNHLSGTAFKAKFMETQNAVILDVRTKAEYNGGHLKGAKNLDFFSSNFGAEAQKLDKTKIYFLYCASGNRSGKACKMMDDLGLQTFNLVGGVGAWPKN